MSRPERIPKLEFFQTTNGAPAETIDQWLVEEFFELVRSAISSGSSPLGTQDLKIVKRTCEILAINNPEVQDILTQAENTRTLP